MSIDLPADLETPVSVFLKVGVRKPHAILLESVELGERMGRYSLIGTDPEIILQYDTRGYLLTCGGIRRHIQAHTPLLAIAQSLLREYRFAADPSLPSLVGGLVGYIGYELVTQFEDIQLTPKKGLPVPDAVLFLPRNLILFDHVKHQVKIIHIASVRNSPRNAYRHALRQINDMKSKLAKPLGFASHRKSIVQKRATMRSNMGRRQFEEKVRRAKAYIRAGDCIQAVLSQRFDLGTARNEFSLYRSLRSVNPSPYMFFFKHPSVSLVGSSPEMLARKTKRMAEVRPIAGTRPRGKTEQEDQKYENALRKSPKEMAEHLMLVDLGRNDLGRVCNARSVQVDHFSHVERYSHVMHLVSDIKATLKNGKTSFDLLKATFPAGTVTGAPKIRAMEIIDELEPEKRGPYAGSLGYFSLNGDLDMCITIRTIVLAGGRAYIQAGAGIVNDSVPSKEYRETVNKAKALHHAVECAGRFV